MEIKLPPQHPMEIEGRGVSDRFEVFLVSIVFATLGAAIQTARLRPEYYQYIVELTSWGLLTSSGILGLARYRARGSLVTSMATFETELLTLTALLDSSETTSEAVKKAGGLGGVSAEAEISNIKARTKELAINVKLAKLKSRNANRLFLTHYILFILGSIGLGVSRAIYQLSESKILKL